MEADPSVPLLFILVIVLLLLGGAYFAMCETAFASVSEIRLITYSDDDPRAKIALKIKNNFDQALTTILIGNNIMHIACSSVATLFVDKLWGNSAVTISTFVITFVIFIFAEMIPKSYANACNEKLCLKLAGSLNAVIILLKPLTLLFSLINRVISIFRKNNKEEESTVSQEELFDIIQNIDEEDKIENDEAELVKSALELTVKTAKDIYIPLDKVECIKTTMSLDEIDNIVLNSNNTRIPVFDKNDKLIGILQIRKYIKSKINNKEFTFNKNTLDKIVYVKENKPIDDLLNYLSLHKTHMAFVIDKHKNLIGILTVEDILEELVGEIYDEGEVNE